MCRDNSTSTTCFTRACIATVVLGLHISSVEAFAIGTASLRDDAYVASINGGIAFIRVEGNRVRFVNEHGGELVAESIAKDEFSTPWGGPKVQLDRSLVWRDCVWHPISGRYIVVLNNKINGIATVEFLPTENVFRFVNEHGGELHAKLSPMGSFESAWGGPRVLPDRTLVWRDCAWHPISGKYIVKHNNGTAWVRHETSEAIFTNENNSTIITTVDKTGRFECPPWGVSGAFTRWRTLDFIRNNISDKGGCSKIT
jgi:hypothetical protein